MKIKPPATQYPGAPLNLVARQNYEVVKNTTPLIECLNAFRNGADKGGSRAAVIVRCKTVSANRRSSCG